MKIPTLFIVENILPYIIFVDVSVVFFSCESCHFFTKMLVGKRRTTISIKDKIILATRVREIRTSDRPGQTIRGLARENNVQPVQLRKWERQLDLLLQRSPTNKFSLRTGRPGLLEPIKDDLLLWLSNLRQDGVPVSIKMVALHAIDLNPEFGAKSISAQYQAVRRLLRSNGYSIRASTRVGQASAAQTRGIATQFMGHVRALVSLPNRAKQWILNMDQTAVFFSMVPRTTLHRRGGRTVGIRNTANGANRITVSLAVTAGGTPYSSDTSTMQVYYVDLIQGF